LKDSHERKKGDQRGVTITLDDDLDIHRKGTISVNAICKERGRIRKKDYLAEGCDDLGSKTIVTPGIFGEVVTD